MRETWTNAGWDRIIDEVRAKMSSSEPAHSTLSRYLAELIEAGQLPAGTKLPPTRYLAHRLGAGRNTILFALNTLVENGQLSARERSGFLVAPNRVAPTERADSQRPAWDRRLEGLELEYHRYPEPTTEGRISFRFGQFDLGLFPTSDWRECERVSSGVQQIELWGQDMVDGDDPQLVEQIRKNVLPQAGVWAQSDELIVTLGAQEGRFLLSLLLARQRWRVGVENPCSAELHRTLRFAGASVGALQMDKEGPTLSGEIERVDAVVVTPGLQYPTTAGMPQTRRAELLEYADRKDLLIVEDTYETEFLHERGGPPALKSQDAAGRVIYIGSLSRQMAPGLRLAFIVAPPKVIRELRVLRRLMHRHPPANNQRSLAIFIERGYYRQFLRRTSKELERRGLVLEVAAREFVPFLNWSNQPGTSAFWFALPPEVSAMPLALAMMDRGVLIDFDRQAFIGHGAVANGVRLCVSGVTDSEIWQGVQTLGEEVKRLQVSV